MKKLLFAVFSLLISCTPAAPQGQKCDIPSPQKSKAMNSNVQVKKKLHIDARFTAEELETIKAAVQEWAGATDGIIEYELVTGFKFNPNKPPPSKIMLLKLTSSDVALEQLGIEDDVASGTLVVPGAEAIIFVTDRINSKAAFKTHVLRNLGTDLGLPTFKGKYPAVMNQDMDMTCLTKYDMILFCTKYTCDWKETNYCEGVNQTKTKVQHI